MKLLTGHLIIAGVLFLLSMGCSSTTSRHDENITMPAVQLRLVNSRDTFNTATLSMDKPVIFYLFSPECAYCSRITDRIKESKPINERFRIIMVSPYAFEEVEQYYDQKKLQSAPGILVGQDTALVLTGYFGITAVPYVAIFGRNKRLVKSYYGDFDVAELESIKL